MSLDRKGSPPMAADASLQSATPAADPLRIDPAVATERIAEAIRLQLAALGRRGVVVAMSGGVDSSVSAALAVKWLVSYLQSHGLAIFGWYRIAIGTVIGGLLLAGVFT